MNEPATVKRRETDKRGYVWEQGAALVAECLATGKEPLFTAQHALHVCEIIIAARESQTTGRRIPIQTTFNWPVVAVAAGREFGYFILREEVQLTTERRNG
jgi:hypothetical protein